MKDLHMNYPTYMELELKHGEVQTINGKELTREGVREVISYIGKEADVKTESVLQTLKALKKQEGQVTLKLFNGVVMAL